MESWVDKKQEKEIEKCKKNYEASVERGSILPPTVSRIAYFMN